MLRAEPDVAELDALTANAIASWHDQVSASAMPTYHPNKTAASNALTDLIRAVLRMNAAAQKSGQALTSGLGLSNARWQTLGELRYAPEPMTVSQLARRMELSRQAVQRLASDMQTDGLVTLADNTDDARARHVVLTEAGRQAYEAALEREWRWTNAVSANFNAAELARAAELLEAVTKAMRHEP